MLIYFPIAAKTPQKKVVGKLAFSSGKIKLRPHKSFHAFICVAVKIFIYGKKYSIAFFSELSIGSTSY